MAVRINYQTPSRVFALAYAFAVAKGRGGPGKARANAVASKKRRELESILSATRGHTSLAKWEKDGIRAAAKRGLKAGHEHLKVFGKSGPADFRRATNKPTRKRFQKRSRSFLLRKRKA